VTLLFDRRLELRVDTLVIRDLRVTFKIERTLKATPNKAEIHVFNLSENHRQQLARLQRVSCSLKVGYEQGETVVFAGDLRSARSLYHAPDWDTTIEGVDGGRARRETRVQRSYRPGTSLEEVMSGIVDSLGLGLGNVAEAVRKAVLNGAGRDFISGTVLTGQPAVEMDDMCRNIGHEWSIQNQTVQVLPIGQSLGGRPLVISAEHGLVGDVEQDAKNGRLLFKTLLIPDLIPGRLIEPRTRTVRGGHYRVTKVVYVGDTDGQEWYCGCEAEPPRRGAA
jgi:hypothetical protein